MVLTQIQLLFSLGDPAKVDGILVGLQSCLGLLKELNGDFDVGVLARGENRQDGILDWVQLVSQALHESLVQDEKVFIRCLVEGLVFEIENQLI